MTSLREILGTLFEWQIPGEAMDLIVDAFENERFKSEPVIDLGAEAFLPGHEDEPIRLPELKAKYNQTQMSDRDFLLWLAEKNN